MGATAGVRPCDERHRFLFYMASGLYWADPKVGHCVEGSVNVLQQAAKSRLCALAHELNNALTAIAGHYELMAEHAEPNSECAMRLHEIRVLVSKMAKRFKGEECRMWKSAKQNAFDKTS